MTKTYTAKELVATYRAAKRWAPNMPFVDVDGEVLTTKEWLEWFRGRLAAKINRHLGVLDVDTMSDLEYDRRQVEAYYHQNRRHSGCRGLLLTRYMQKRFPEVNNQAREDEV